MEQTITTSNGGHDMTTIQTDEETAIELTVPEAFHVHDETSANWVVRKIVEARAYADRVQQWAAKEIRRAKREEDFFILRFGGQLEDWARQQIEAGPLNRKSIMLPAGTIGFRRQPLRLEIQDEAKLLAWCKNSLPEAIVMSERVLKTALVNHFTNTGECLDGADVAGGSSIFYVR